MGVRQKLEAYPFCRYLLSGYLSKKQDLDNFPTANPESLQQYETLFASALRILGIQKEALRKKPEFTFDSGDPANFESAIAILRVVVFLHQKSFARIALIKSGSTTGADITCEKGGRKVCCEVKTMTKQSRGRKAHFLKEQVYEKMKESISIARSQLRASAAELQCDFRFIIFVINWFLQSVTLDQAAYQDIVDRLEEEQGLDGIDCVVFITAVGQDFGFLSEQAKSLDW